MQILGSLLTLILYQYDLLAWPQTGTFLLEARKYHQEYLADCVGPS